jgi:hypothetical protein
VGLALHLGIHLSTAKRWSKEPDKGEFKAIFGAVKDAQHKILIDNGLTGEFNSTIAKVILTKHNYTDKQQLTVEDITKKPEDDLRSELAKLLRDGESQGDSA